MAESDLSQKVLLLVEGIYYYFAQHFGSVNRRQHRNRGRQGKINNIKREQKNEMRKKYRAARRSNQPKVTIIQLAIVLTITWLESTALHAIELVDCITTPVPASALWHSHLQTMYTVAS